MAALGLLLENFVNGHMQFTPTPSPEIKSMPNVYLSGLLLLGHLIKLIMCKQCVIVIESKVMMS